jgi:Tfp pilus assembly protein PilZ
LKYRLCSNLYRANILFHKQGNVFSKPNRQYCLAPDRHLAITILANNVGVDVAGIHPAMAAEQEPETHRVEGGQLK